MPPKKTDTGFSQANSNNLPAVTSDMVDLYYEENAQFFIAGVQNVKTKRATRLAYGDDAVGYVQVKRENSTCIGHARITPEHRVRQQGYLVTVLVDETQNRIEEAECKDCPASEGGCKHEIALIFWLLRRHEQPSVTSTECYWKKSTLSTIGDCKSKKMTEIFQGNPPLPARTTTFLDAAVAVLSKKQSEAHLVEYFRTAPTLLQQVSMHHMMLRFKSEIATVQADNFLEFAKRYLTSAACKKICTATSSQSASPEWFAARFARITASKFYEVAHCTVYDGSTTEAILGAHKFAPSKAMMRGLDLEKEVLKVLSEKMNFTTKKVGLHMKPQFPIFGASPDSISDEFCIEIKCPSKESTVGNYLKDGQVVKKHYAQMQLQMLLCDRQKSIFCVASPFFENDKQITTVEVNFDETYCKKMMLKAETFWKQAIFPKLIA